ncbi:MAG TPA: TonB-dependent receptor [Steroidobacteraceae bacterium]|nr:TonB-dependent receptor [Steroidobacteraceae bacterium]
MNRNSEVTLAVRRALVMGAAATTGLTTLPAHAQDQTPSAEQPETTVTVTGTRIRRVDQETANPVFVMDQSAIQSAGVSTLGELLQRVPSVAGAATNPQVNNGGGTGESNIELRGLSAQRTLVLLNGRRINILGNTTTSAVDINLIPINVIERVEVLKEGAGAVYGSDAIAGVVNFITRKDVDGAEATAQYGQTGKTDGKSTQYGLVLGTSTDKMNLMVAGNYNKQDAVSANDRDFSRFALYLYGGAVSVGGSSRTPTGRIRLPVDQNGDPIPGSLADQFGCTSVTRDPSATGTPLAGYRCFQNSDLYNYQPFNLLITPQERGSLFSNINYNINDYVTAYGEALYTHTRSGFELASLPFDAVADDTIISQNSIYNPFGTSFGGVEGNFPNFQSRLESLGTRRSNVTTQDALVNGGLKGKILDTGWEWDANFSYGHKDQLQDITGYLLKDKLAQAVGPSFIDASGVARCGTPATATSPEVVIPGCTPIDLFNLSDPTQIAALQSISTNYRTDYVYRSKGATLNVNGKIFELPAGDLQLAVGAEYRDQEGQFTTDALTRGVPPLFLSCLLAQETCSGNSFAKYNVKEYYAEVFAPLLKDLPGVHALNLNAGIRRSDYSKDTIGNSTNAEFKLEDRPISDVLVRASYAEVFRAPTIADLSFAPTQDSPTFADPCTNLTSAQLAANPNLNKACAGVIPDSGFTQPNSQITGLIIGSQNLKPETGDVRTFGVVYDSSLIRGLSLTVDYWKYKLDDLITQLDPNFAANQCVLTGNDQFCGLMFRYPSTSNNAGLFQVFQEPIVNLGKLKTDGVDFGIKYAIRQTAIGSFNFSLDVTHINSYENTPAPGAEPIEIAGTFNRQFGNYAKNRGLLGVGWAYAGLDALLTLRYVGKLEVTDPDGAIPNAPPLKISAYTYTDLTVGYNFPTNTRVQVGAINLMDKQPPLFYQNNVINANTDVSTYDTLGRRWFIGLTQKF